MTNKTELEKIIEGLQIIQRHEPDAYLAYEYDQIWCGEYSEKYSIEEKIDMEELGWFANENSWSHF